MYQVNNLAQSLITNKLSLNSLTYLNLAGNCLKEEVTNLVSFLAQVNGTNSGIGTF